MSYEKYINRNIQKEIADKYGINKGVVDMVCNHPFLFAKRCISDETNEYPIMFANMFKIRLKNRYTGGNKIIARNENLKRIEEKLLKKSSN